MKHLLTRLPAAFSALRQLGPARSFWYGVYQAGLRSGHYRRISPSGGDETSGRLNPPYPIPDAGAVREVTGGALPQLTAEADEIVDGMVRLFGREPVALQLAPPDSSRHWTYYEGRPGTWGVEDIKLIWEPARFGWVYPLGRAYLITGDERYPAAFWKYLEVFQSANPPNMGPNWSSGQEVGLRLLALLFAAKIFAGSGHTTLERVERLTRAVAEHAARIPPTLSYARAQNNNHRIVEALAIYAAGTSLPDHRKSRQWQRLGWHELNRALLSQIEPDGTYTQHSMNYHRLMLHAALQGLIFGREYPEAVQLRLASATRWLLAQVDAQSGRAPNLGSNDGALILPLACGGFEDYRPTAQAAARAFLGRAAFPPGAWDETSLWLDLSLGGKSTTENQPANPAVHRLGSAESWATLRAVRFTSRPSHADQLHVDLWWRGENIALDAGTYRYTAPAPWDNTLAQTRAHNTIEIDQQNQMRRAGRFLWLDWAQARLLPAQAANSLAAQHDGYRKLGVLHRRTLEQVGANGWRITDELLPASPDRTSKAHDCRLHWLLPDWPWQIDGNTLRLDRPGGGTVRLTISTGPLSLIRAGKVLAGEHREDPILGWFSPTYNEKVPALSLVATVRAALPVTITSAWSLEPGSA